MSKMKKVWPLCAAIVVGLTFLFLTKLIRDPALAFSHTPYHRFQIAAFLRGTLALQDQPFFAGNDWIWARGAHQIWGLGVPLLMMPLELPAYLAGWPGFPDRWWFVIFLAAVGAFLLRTSIGRPQEWATSAESRWRIPLGLGILALTVFNPTLIALCRTRFLIYEETIAVSCLWGLLEFGVLWHFLKRRSPAAFLGVAFASGFGSLVRPTLIFYGISIMALAFIYGGQVSRRWRWTGAGIYIALVASLFVTNYLRFGAPFEFGFATTFNTVPRMDYILKFDYAYSQVPLGEAVKELVGALFAHKTFHHYEFWQAGLHAGQSSFPRMREYYFQTYSWLEAGCLLIGWLAFSVCWLRRRRSAFAAQIAGDPVIVSAFVFSTSATLLLAGFYLRNLSFISRYAVDFLPAFSVALIGSLLLLIKWFESRQLPRWPWHPFQWVLLGILLLSAISIARIEIDPHHAYLPGVAAEHSPRVPYGLHLTAGLPDRYICGGGRTEGLPLQYFGWRVDTDCGVLETTELMVNPADCYTLAVGPGKDNRDPDYSVIRVKLNREFLDRVSNEPTSEGRALKFCRRPGRVLTPDHGLDIPFRMLTIAWVGPGNEGNLPDLKFNSVTKTER